MNTANTTINTTNAAELDAQLVDASEDGRVEVVRLLIAAGADVHRYGDYALRAASLNGHAEVVQMLLYAGANVHARDSSALRYAVENGHVEVIKILTNWKGANK